MNLKVNLGKDKNDSDVVIDLVKENIHFVILAGESGSGKSIFHSMLYKQLVEQNTSKELRFVIFDTNRVELTGWKSPFVEINMQAYDEQMFEKALRNFLISNKHALIVFSTSRIGEETLTENIRKLAD